MAQCIQNGMYSAKFRRASAAVDNGIVAALSFTGWLHTVFRDGILGCMTQLFDRLQTARNFCTTNTAVNDRLIAAIFCTAGSFLVFLNGITLGMTQRRKGRNFSYIAARAALGDRAICCTGCCLDNFFAPGMAELFNDSDVCLAFASAAVSGLAAFGYTGRLFVYRKAFCIIMAQCIQNGMYSAKFRRASAAVDNGIVAALSFTGWLHTVFRDGILGCMTQLFDRLQASGYLCITYAAVNYRFITAGFRTSGSHRVFLNSLPGSVALRCDSLCHSLAASQADFCFGTCFCTGGQFGNAAFVPIVAQCLNGSNIRFTITTTAVTGFTAGFCTGRCFVYGEVFIIVVTGCCSILMLARQFLMANGTVYHQIITAGTGTGGINSFFLHSFPFCMSKQGNRIRHARKFCITNRTVDDFIIAAGSGTRCIHNIFPHRRIFLMTCSCDRLCLSSITSGAAFRQNAVSRTGRRCGDNAFVPIVTQSHDDSNLCYIVASAAVS